MFAFFDDCLVAADGDAGVVGVDTADLERRFAAVANLDGAADSAAVGCQAAEVDGLLLDDNLGRFGALAGRQLAEIFVDDGRQRQRVGRFARVGDDADGVFDEAIELVLRAVVIADDRDLFAGADSCRLEDDVDAVGLIGDGRTDGVVAAVIALDKNAFEMAFRHLTEHYGAVAQLHRIHLDGIAARHRGRRTHDNARNRQLRAFRGGVGIDLNLFVEATGAPGGVIFDGYRRRVARSDGRGAEIGRRAAA